MFDKLTCLLLLLLMAGLLCGQTTNGTLLGVVSDPSGAVVPGASVQVRHEQTGITRDLVTDETGLYQALALPIGQYSVTVSAPGLQRTSFTGLVLQVQQTLRFDISLKVTQQVEAVTVNASTPLLDADSAAVGAVIDNSRLIEMPLNGRNFNQLSLLSPGVVQFYSGGGAVGFGGQLSIGISTNGTRFKDQNYLIDGMSNYNTFLYSTGIDVSLDMIQEFRLQTATYSAEYGVGGGSVSVAFKSGTNSFHGSAFEYLRNPHLTARNFFSPTPQILRRNQFGGTVGGPVVRNHTFFFFGYEGVRQRQASLPSGTVFSLDEREGKMNFDIRDPLTGLPFPNRTIPATRFDPVAKLALETFVPKPNSGTSFGVYPSSSPLDNNQYGLKIDHLFSNKDNIFGRYMRYRQSSKPVFGVGLMDYDNSYPASHTALGWTHSFSPSIINELRGSYRREGIDQFNISKDTKQKFSFTQAAGIKGVDTFTSGAPFFSLPGIGAGYIGSFFAPATFTFDTYELSDNLSYVRGEHTFRAGVDIRRTWQRADAYATGRGVYNYTGVYTGLPIADFLIGAPSSVSATQAAPVSYLRWAYISSFVQDDWKVSQNLTLNLGLRWGVDVPPYDKYDQFATFDYPSRRIVLAGDNGQFPVAANPIIIGNSPGVFVSAKDAGYPSRSLRDTNWFDLDPRFGFAWRVLPKTVLRGGYGISHAPRDAYSVLNQARGVPFGGASYSINNTMPIPTIDTKDPFRTATAGGPTATPGGTFFPRGSPTGYLQQFSFNVQRAITDSTKVEVGYVGSKGTHLLNNYTTFNSPQPGPGPIEPRRPIQGLGAFGVFRNDGNLIYHSLQVNVNQRLAEGLSLTSAFTWGKAIDTNSGQFYNSVSYDIDFNNPRLSRARSDNDVAARWVTSYIYELPFGRGKRFLDRGGILNGIIGGWQLSGIFTLQSGLPFSVVVAGDPANVSAVNGFDRPDRIAPGNNITPTVARWFDPDAFVVAGDTQLPLAQRTDFRHGNAGRNILNADGIINLDSGLFKTFQITERHKIQARFEAFNVSNHPNFGAPNNSIIASKVPGSPTSAVNPNFGRVSSASAPRILQVALRYVF